VRELAGFGELQATIDIRYNHDIILLMIVKRPSEETAIITE
jgi:hypothetical protein